ncbi:MAG TPA: molybdopterin cofactor-binding domain-containing protein, partial [Micromonosporaceae bacterium]|nr:molybdopterin cofactor-binding domain-containing protein [Micromonosporaceae bacterium]
MVRLTVNGVAHEVDDQERSLLDVLREDLGLTGTKYGCGQGECGACTVLVGDNAVRSCLLRAGVLDGAAVTTVEGLADGTGLHPVQEAFVGCRAFQCGFCTPGMVMSAVALLRADPAPDDTAIRDAMAGNICRCGGYPMVMRAIRDASTGPAGTGPAGTGTAGTGTAAGGPADTTVSGAHEPATATWTAVLRLDDGPAETSRSWGWSNPGGARITIDDRGRVVAYCGKVDAGQGNRVSLGRMVAAELRTDAASVRMVLGDTGVAPYDLGTFGSRSTPDAGPALRLTAAAIRDELVRAAADRWQVAPDLLEAAGGTVREPGGAREIAYAELVAAGPRTIRVDPDAPLAPAPTGLGDLADGGDHDLLVAAVTGAKRFPSDATVPGMWHGVVLRPPRHGDVLESLDAGAARELPDVAVVHDGDFAAVAAPTPHAARAALALLRPVWRSTPRPAQADLENHLRTNPAPVDPDREDPGRDIGDVDKAAADAAYLLEATYTTAYVAHVPMETRVALAAVDDAGATVRVGSQRPFAVRAAVAAALGLDESRVRVVVPDFGGGFGGKHTPDVAVEAARLSRASGHPVRVAWTRAEELAWAYFRPAAVIDVRASAGSDGTVTGWEFTNINSGGAGLVSPYATENVRERYQPARSPLPQGSYRALAATANNFARESHLDDLADVLRVDPVELRLRHLTDPRLAGVLTAVAKHVGWSNREHRAGYGIGIACGVEKEGRVATAAEVEVDREGVPRVTRIVTGIDCGPVIDPVGLRMQVTGATVMGLGGALFEAVRFDGGRIDTADLGSYRVPRFPDIPEIDVVVVERADCPAAGAGEAPIIAVAPAIANAIFAATGR